VRRILITGAAGFIGSAFAREAITKGYQVCILDSLTYAGHMENLEEILTPGVCDFVQADIRDFDKVDALFDKYSFDGVVNFAAESHVDNSISGPKAFIETNILGTFNLLEVARKHWSAWPSDKQNVFRFLHVSTDEVFGALGETGKFTEATPYAPNSPYSASKACSDHLVRAWHHTYALPTITTNCSNNYGPRQFPEKLIPLMIHQALQEKPLPVYGRGVNVRDWIHVDDHSRGVLLAFEKGKPGGNYCFGGNSERNNLQVVKSICAILDRLSPRQDGKPHESRIEFVQDRKGHDFRYAIDDSLAQNELGFRRSYPSFEQGLEQTIKWYLTHQQWSDQVISNSKKKLKKADLR
jgi:dTDP-glucose 4,6-dehydratase